MYVYGLVPSHRVIDKRDKLDATLHRDQRDRRNERRRLVIDYFVVSTTIVSHITSARLHQLNSFRIERSISLSVFLRGLL